MEINKIGIYNDPSIIQKKAESIKENKDDEKLMDVCKEFESIFLSMMFKQMKDTIPEGGLIEKSFGTEVFEDMYIDKISEEITSQKSLGLAKMLYDQFVKGYVSW